jgi:hypothetical protein
LALKLKVENGGFLLFMRQDTILASQLSSGFAPVALLIINTNIPLTSYFISKSASKTQVTVRLFCERLKGAAVD